MVWVTLKQHCGAIDMGAADNTAPLPSPQDFGIASTSSTSVSPGAHNLHDPPSKRSQSSHRNTSFSSGSTRPFRSLEEICRKVFLAEFDLDSMTPAPTASAYLKLKPEQCTVTDVAQMSKEYLNIKEDLIILDTNGFDILDNPGTSGKLTARYRHLHGGTYQTCSAFNHHYYYGSYSIIRRTVFSRKICLRVAS